MAGQEILKVLAQRGFPVERVTALASERSKGLTVSYNGSTLQVEPITEASFKGIDLALFAASGDIGLMYAPIAVEAGAVVIDLRSALPIKAHVPLRGPEGDPDDLRDNK